jgi:hypothetical protein
VHTILNPQHRTGARLPDAERKARDTRAALCALAEATFNVSDDDRGRPVFVINQGSRTYRFRSLEEVDGWLSAFSEVTT